MEKVKVMVEEKAGEEKAEKAEEKAEEKAAETAEVDLVEKVVVEMERGSTNSPVQ